MVNWNRRHGYLLSQLTSNETSSTTKKGLLRYENAELFILAEIVLSYELKEKKDLSIIKMSVDNSVEMTALEASISCLLSTEMREISKHVQMHHDTLDSELIQPCFTSSRTKHNEVRSSILSFYRKNIFRLIKFLRGSVKMKFQHLVKIAT